MFLLLFSKKSSLQEMLDVRSWKNVWKVGVIYVYRFRSSLTLKKKSNYALCVCVGGTGICVCVCALTFWQEIFLHNLDHLFVA